MKRENEAVINRFLLSTLYIILGEFLLFFMYKASCTSMAVNMPIMYYAMMVIAGVGLVISIVSMVMGKKQALYYLVLSAVVLLIALFLSFYYVIDIPVYSDVVYYTSKRYIVAAIFAALFYIYEIVYYFMNVNKAKR